MSNYLVHSFHNAEHDNDIRIYPAGLVIVTPCNLPKIFSQTDLLEHTGALSDFIDQVMTEDPDALFYTLPSMAGVYTPAVLLYGLYASKAIQFVIERHRVLTYSQIIPYIGELCDPPNLPQIGSSLDILLKIHHGCFIKT